MSSELTGHNNKGLAFVLSAPAGTGKTTLVEKLMKEYPNVKESISCTTRPPRSVERHHRHYQFVTQEEFDKKVENDDFLEHVRLFNYSYGTPRQAVLDEQEKGNHVIMVIDTQGALQLRETFPAILIFVSPPSLDELANRLQKRKTESKETLKHRMQRAEEELKMVPYYDYHIVNHHLETAYQALRSILVAEVHRVRLTDTHSPS